MDGKALWLEIMRGSLGSLGVYALETTFAILVGSDHEDNGKMLSV